MRLLNSATEKLVSFDSEGSVPVYAILSHRWGDDEATFYEVDSQDPAVKKKKGYKKISYACKEAHQQGIEWVWVDTCCIDKRSSAELSEAINSMFTWYRNAAVCYAFISDIVTSNSNVPQLDQFKKSRWFTRGWTLQELLAPTTVLFYSAEWTPLGSRETLSQAITDVTGIEDEFLCGRDLRHASVAKRMSWAAHRETARIEDIAYCLLGIFDVNMPLLYGEGKKAFIRLQQEIMRHTHDFSLFAWGVFEPTKTPEPTNPDASASHLVTWHKDTSPLKGLLAESPRLFAHSGSVIMHKTFIDSDIWIKRPPILTNGGIQIQLPCLPEWIMEGAYSWQYPDIEQPRQGFIANLLCKIGEDGSDSIGIPLVRWGHLKCGRRDNMVLLKYKPYQPLLSRQVWQSLQDIFVKPELRPELRDGDILIRHVTRSDVQLTNWDYFSLFTEYTSDERLIRPRAYGTSTRIFSSSWKSSKTLTSLNDFVVVFGKVRVDGVPLAARPLYVAFKALVGEDKMRIIGLYADLEGRQTLQVPRGEARWTYKDDVTAVDVVIKSERVSCVRHGKNISVDVIDMDLRTRELDSHRRTSVSGIKKEV
ncbi:heterokaryon incompatibility protein-domain-containing protein [Podospora conica]|nr:heterokaryon incompatibility protein-domain-containing protein [Schizothecium conicum]